MEKVVPGTDEFLTYETEKVYCWYVITCDRADNAYCGHEGPFWTEDELLEHVKGELARPGVEPDGLDIINVPLKLPTF